jgi:hypothetical protein
MVNMAAVYGGKGRDVQQHSFFLRPVYGERVAAQLTGEGLLNSALPLIRPVGHLLPVKNGEKGTVRII